MTEDQLHFVWKYQRFSPFELKTITGDTILVFSVGTYNQDAGPDFLNAKIQIGDEVWSGHVEIHKKSKDWNVHRHQDDEAYNNVILHVVYEFNGEVATKNKVMPPTLELKGKVDQVFLERYKSLHQTFENIPCESQIQSVDDFVKKSFLSSVLIERLEQKTKRIQAEYIQKNFSLQEVFYSQLVQAFGQKTNKEAFALLVDQLPLNVLLKHTHDKFSIEALLFGVSGFLEGNMEDEYSQELQQNFKHLSNKYQLHTLQKSIWKFSKLRPPNFPTLRLAQLASCLCSIHTIFNLLHQTPNYKTLKKLLAFKASRYWDTHYHFGQPSKELVKQVGESFKNHLIINVFVPFYFFYKQRTGSASIELIDEILSQIPAEKNRITKKMMAVGFYNGNAFHSQSLYMLHEEYCAPQKCLNCRIGYTLLKNSNDDRQNKAVLRE